MGFGSVYEQELHIRIVDGLVVARRTIDNRGRSLNETELAVRISLAGRISSTATTTGTESRAPASSREEWIDVPLIREQEFGARH
jgi:hypothetical protein